MALVKEVSVRVTATGIEDAKLKIDRLTVAAKELGDQKPEIKAQIDATKALLEARLLREGIKKELAGSLDVGGGGGGLLSKLFGTGGSGLSGSLSGAPLVGGLLNQTGIYGLAGVTAAVAALLPEVVGLVSGITAAATGLGAFGLLALPTLNGIKNAYTGVQTAQQGVVSAQKTYTDAVEKNKLDPTKANAAAVQTALLKVKVAQEDLARSSAGPGAVVPQIQSLMKEFDQLAKGFQPTALLIVGDALKVAHTLLPDLQPFATAAGGAIDGLLGKVNTFFQSADFKKWLDKFVTYVGPSLTALGTGMGQVAVNFGKLLTVLPPPDVVRAISYAFDAVNGSLEILTGTIKIIMGPLSTLASIVSFLGGGGNSGGGAGLGAGLPNVANIPKGLGNVNYNALNKLPNLTPPVVGSGPGSSKLGHLAAGGISPGGWTVVGENGPELMRLPQGSQVYPSGQSAGMLGGGGNVVVRLFVGDRELKTVMKKVIRTSGGNPAVMGR